MKKSLIYIAAAAVALASCAKTDLVRTPAGGDVPISFSPYLGRETTKATSLGAGDSFKVTAFHKHGSPVTEDGYYANQKYEWNGTSSFVSTPVHYWPTGGTLDFYAVMPEKYQGPVQTDITVDPSTKTVDFTADGKTDFSAVLLAGQTKPAGNPAVNPTLSFGHKLTKVSFKAKGADTNLKYVITSATVTADAKGTYSFSSTGGSWTRDTLTPTNTTYTAIVNDTVAYNSISAVSLGESLYLMPKQGTDSNTVKLTINYKVFALDAEATASDRLVYQGTRYLDLTVTAKDRWAINRSITYSMILPVSEDDSEISFTSTLGDWNPSTVRPRPEGALCGEFSVSPTKRVFFSKGTLQAVYNSSTSSYSWRFASNQYDLANHSGTSGNFYVGTSGMRDGYVVDLFGWVGSSGSLPPYGISASVTAANYGTTDYESLKSDWGTAIDTIGTWRTLTGGQYTGEWHYLFNVRKVTVGGEEKTPWGFGKVANYEGCLLLPDDWDGSVYGNFVYGTSATIPSENTFSSTTTPTWSEMEAAGVVFFPYNSIRYRNNGDISPSSKQCTLWTSTSWTGNFVYLFYLTSNEVRYSATERTEGHCVRLVSDIE